MVLDWIAQLTLLVAIISVFGIVLGKINIKGFTLGIGGVLFGGIIISHFVNSFELVDLNAPAFESARHYLQEFGLILFVYAIGNSVGPSFFASLKASGAKLISVALIVIIGGFLVTFAIFELTDVTLPEILGVYSGAVTNTPALGAANQMISDVAVSAPNEVKDLLLNKAALDEFLAGNPDPVALSARLLQTTSTLGEGYAVAYPFGILGIFITLILMKIIFKVDISQAGKAFEKSKIAAKKGIVAINVRVTNSHFDGKMISELPRMDTQTISCSRMKRGSSLMVPHHDDVVRVDDILHLVGAPGALENIAADLGEKVEISLSTKGTDMTSSRVIVTNSKVMGKKLGELGLDSKYDVVVSRFTRTDVELVPDDTITLQFGDIINVVGLKDAVEGVARELGDSHQKLQQVYPLPLFLGIVLGVILGSIAIPVPGIPAALKLGIAGGPLVMAIILSRFGSSLTFGKVHWFMPRSANMAIKEVGIVLFLACVGLKAGQTFFASVASAQGLMWMFYGVLITLVPLMIAAFVAMFVLKVNYLSMCGAISGACTDPPALAYSNALYSSPEATSLGYATVYPFTMFMRIMSPQIFVVLAMLIHC
jgi:putative transport protein